MRSSCNWGYTVVAWCWTSSESSRDVIVLSDITVMSTTLRNRFLGTHLTGWLLWGPGKFICTWIYLFSFGLCPGSLVPTDLKKWRARDWAQCPMKLWGFPSWLNGRTSFLSLQPPVMEFLLFLPHLPYSSRQQRERKGALGPGRPELEFLACWSLLLVSFWWHCLKSRSQVLMSEMMMINR